MAENYEFMVGVRCLTYQQARYIEAALDGFAMQTTNFPYLVMLIDDASTDGEQDVISNYMKNNFDLDDHEISWQKEDADAKFVFARHKCNENCYFLSLNLKVNLWNNREKKDSLLGSYLDSYKYFTVCEGDDYWIDPDKLQKQVDFLESNEDFSICYHPVKVWDERSQMYVEDTVVDDNPADSTIVDLAKSNYIHTLSVMYRRNSNEIMLKRKFGIIRVSDYLTHMLYAECGKIHRIDDCMGVYRQGVGVWTKDADSMRQSMDWIVAISKLYGMLTNEEAKKVLDKQIENYRNSCLELYKCSVEQELMARNSKAYKLGRFLLHPFSIFKRK